MQIFSRTAERSLKGYFHTHPAVCHNNVTSLAKRCQCQFQSKFTQRIIVKKSIMRCVHQIYYAKHKRI